MIDHIICLSENTRQVLQDDYQINPDKIIVVYNGLTDHNAVTIKQAVLQQKYHIPRYPDHSFCRKIEQY
jgi:hypothetical protein